MSIRDKLINTVMKARKEWGLSYMDKTGNLAVFEVDSILAEFAVLERAEHARMVAELGLARIEKYIGKGKKQ